MRAPFVEPSAASTAGIFLLAITSTAPQPLDCMRMSGRALGTMWEVLQHPASVLRAQHVPQHEHPRGLQLRPTCMPARSLASRGAPAAAGASGTLSPAIATATPAAVAIASATPTAAPVSMATASAITTSLATPIASPAPPTSTEPTTVATAVTHASTTDAFASSPPATHSLAAAAHSLAATPLAATTALALTTLSAIARTASTAAPARPAVSMLTSMRWRHLLGSALHPELRREPKLRMRLRRVLS